MTTEAVPQTREEVFVQRLFDLSRRNSGRSNLMTLRSCLTYPTGVNPAVYPLLGDVLPDLHGTDADRDAVERAWVLVAALFGAWHTATHVGPGKGRGKNLSIGTALAMSSQQRAAEVQIEILTRVPYGQIRNALHRSVLMLSKENIQPGWLRLLNHLTDGDRPVSATDFVRTQRGWAYDYYHNVKTPRKNQTERHSA